MEKAEYEGTFHSMWGLMIYIDMCSEFTRVSVPDIMTNMSIVDMLFYCMYVVSKRSEEKKQLEKIRNK